MWTEEASETALEVKYMTKQRRNMVLVLEELDFTWCEDEITEYIKLWNSGGDIRKIAEHFERDPDELLLLHIHLARKGKIQPRKGGL